MRAFYVYQTYLCLAVKHLSLMCLCSVCCRVLESFNVFKKGIYSDKDIDVDSSISFSVMLYQQFLLDYGCNLHVKQNAEIHRSYYSKRNYIYVFNYSLSAMFMSLNILDKIKSVFRNCLLYQLNKPRANYSQIITYIWNLTWMVSVYFNDLELYLTAVGFIYIYFTFIFIQIGLTGKPIISCQSPKYQKQLKWRMSKSFDSNTVSVGCCNYTKKTVFYILYHPSYFNHFSLCA